MDYAYVKAYDIFKRNFQIGDLIPLFRELKSRDVCPENWERQIKFWSMLIKAWGNNSNVIEFSVDLTNCLTSGYSSPVSTKTAGTSGNIVRTKCKRTVESLPPEKETYTLPSKWS